MDTHNPELTETQNRINEYAAAAQIAAMLTIAAATITALAPIALAAAAIKKLTNHD